MENTNTRVLLSCSDIELLGSWELVPGNKVSINFGRDTCTVNGEIVSPVKLR